MKTVFDRMMENNSYGEPIHLDTIVPAIYGEIAECGYRSEAEIQELVEANGGVMDESFSKPLLCTTLAQRTGCSMCGFGVHMEKRPHRFDLLWERNPKEWDLWMHHIEQDASGNWSGWDRVLDYIGVEWRNPEQFFGGEKK